MTLQLITVRKAERGELGLSRLAQKSLENNQLNSKCHTSWVFRDRRDLGEIICFSFFISQKKKKIRQAMNVASSSIPPVSGILGLEQHGALYPLWHDKDWGTLAYTFKKLKRSQTQWHALVLQHPRGRGRRILKYKAILRLIVNWRPVWATWALAKRKLSKETRKCLRNSC